MKHLPTLTRVEAEVIRLAAEYIRFGYPYPWDFKFQKFSCNAIEVAHREIVGDHPDLLDALVDKYASFYEQSRDCVWFTTNEFASPLQDEDDLLPMRQNARVIALLLFAEVCGSK